MIDKKDKAILNVLLDDGEASYRKISKKAGISLGTVMNRMKKLKEKGLLKKFVPLLDYDKMGYGIGVIIDLRISKGKLMEVGKTIARNPFVFLVYDITGDFDVSVIARFPSRDKLDSFVKNLQRMAFVERTNTKLILNYLKEEPPKFSLGLR